MRTLSTLILPLALALCCGAQQVSPELINHTEGVVLLNGRPASGAVSLGDMLTTGAFGYAEVLLDPGVFLRIGPNAAVRCTSSVVSLVRGEVLLDVVARPRQSKPFLLAGIEIAPAKTGLYEFDAGTRRLRVYAGEIAGVKRGDQADVLSGALEVSRFDSNQADALYVWSARMAELAAGANYGVVISKADHHTANWYWNQNMHRWAYVPSEKLIVDSFGWIYLANTFQLESSVILSGPQTGYPAAVNRVSPPRILTMHAPNASIDLAHARRIDRPAPPETANPPMDAAPKVIPVYGE